MKKIICLFLMMCCVISLFGCGQDSGVANSTPEPEPTPEPTPEPLLEDSIWQEYNADKLTELRNTYSILFNDIPYGINYYDTLVALKEIYNIEFDEPEYHEETEGWTVLGDKGSKTYNSSGIVSFSVNSTEEVEVAGHPAKIVLTFYFLNDGEEIFFDDLEKTAFTNAEYRIIAVNSNEVHNELLIKLESLYGTSKTDKNDSNVMEGENSKVSISKRGKEIQICYDVSPNDWKDSNSNILFRRAKALLEDARQQEKENIENIKNGDKSGL